MRLLCTQRQYTFLPLKAIFGSLKDTQKSTVLEVLLQNSRASREERKITFLRERQRHKDTKLQFERNAKAPTADAVSLLSERARSKSLRVSSLVLFFFPLGTGSFSFFCFLFRFSIPMSQRGHNTWWAEKPRYPQHCQRVAMQPRVTS